MQNRGRLSEHQAAVVLFEVLQMVAACHRVGVCHGDIKPANFLMAKRLPQVCLSTALSDGLTCVTAMHLYLTTS